MSAILPCALSHRVIGNEFIPLDTKEKLDFFKVYTDSRHFGICDDQWLWHTGVIVFSILSMSPVHGDVLFGLRL